MCAVEDVWICIGSSWHRAFGMGMYNVEGLNIEPRDAILSLLDMDALKPSVPVLSVRVAAAAWGSVLVVHRLQITRMRSQRLQTFA